MYQHYHHWGHTQVTLNEGRVDTEEIDIGEAYVEETDVEEADVEEAYVEETDIEEADVEEADVEEADLVEADVEGMDEQDVNIAEVNYLDHLANWMSEQWFDSLESLGTSGARHCYHSHRCHRWT